MTNLADLRKSIKEHGEGQLSKKILLMGAPKSGKSILAATIAKASEISRVFYFDLERSIESILLAPDTDIPLALTDEEMAKITLVPIQDTSKDPRASETILKTFTAPAEQPVNLCTTHGIVDCKCKDGEKIPFSLSALSPSDAVIIDSGSQLADSVLNLEMLTEFYKDLRKYYGAFTIEMGAIMSAIQASSCSVVMVTHLYDIMSQPSDPKVTPKLLEIAPLLGSRNYSKNKGGKYFGWTIMTEERDGKYLIGGTPKFKDKAKLGNRAGKRIEAYPDFDLSWIFLDPAKWPEPTGTVGPKIKL